MTGQLECPSNRAVRFLLLGQIEAFDETSGDPVPLGPDHERRLLVALLEADRRSISRDRVIEAVWDDAPPKDAAQAVWRLVSNVRTRLEKAGLGTVLKNNRSTYWLDVPAEQTDLHRFRAMSAEARALIGHDDRRAGALLEEALGMHRGVPLAGLNGSWVDHLRATIIEEHRMAETSLYELAIRLDKSREVLPKLVPLYREHPGDEAVAWLYMHALYRSGRQADALEVFHEVRRHLDETIGGHSLEALADLHQRMLDHDPALLTPEAVAFGSRGGTASTSRTGHAGGTDEDAREAAADEDGREPVTGTAGDPARNGPLITAHEIGNANVFGPLSVGNDLNFNA